MTKIHLIFFHLKTSNGTNFANPIHSCSNLNLHWASNTVDLYQISYYLYIISYWNLAEWLER